MPPDKLSPKKTCGPSGELLAVWHVEQFVWNHKRTKAQRHTMLIEAKSCAEAATLAGDADGTHEIQVIRRSSVNR